MNGFLRRRCRVLAILVAASALQFAALDAQSLWYDEGFSIWLSSRPFDEIVTRTANDIQPPLYYLLLGSWVRLAGQSEWALRFPSALFALLTIPLLWQVARRLFRRETAADLAALLIAFSPLWLWYGREARMYTFALALLLGAALALLVLLRSDVQSRSRWIASLLFAVLVTAAGYTHYYSWFLVAGWGLVALVLWVRGRGIARAPLALAFLLPLAGYLPWVAVVVRRLGEDRSYWSGALSPLFVITRTAASWMAGHSLHEAQALPLGLFGLTIALLGLVAAWPRGRPGDRPAWWLLALWLVVPFLGLLLLSWNRPKFHPRYMIFAAPAFYLLVARLLARRRDPLRLVALLVALVIAASWIVADWNLYRDPAFAKADWRGVAGYLERHLQPGDEIALVSGHAFPVLDYYLAPPESRLLLPDEPTLDTTVVLGLDAAHTLALRLKDRSRLWLVEWQEEVVDPEGIVPALLRAVGATRQTTPHFMEVELSEWWLPESVAPESALEPEQKVEQHFEDALELLGWSTPPLSSPVDGGLPLTLFWEAERPLESDYKVRLEVVDEAGYEYGSLDQRPTAYNYPTFRWRPGEPRLATVVIPLEPGSPPGWYWVDVTVYDATSGTSLDILDEAGAPQGRSLRIGPISLSAPQMSWLGAGPPSNATPVGVDLLEGQQLVAAWLTMPSQLEPGQRLPITLWWRTPGPLPDGTLHLGWARGSEQVEGTRLALDGERWAGPSWKPGDLLMTPLTVRVPREMATGHVRLIAWMSDARGRRGETVTLGVGSIAESERRFEPPPTGHAQHAEFAGSIGLVGYELDERAIAPGESRELTLHWHAIEENDRSLTSFVHLLDAEGRIVPDAGQDRLPLDGQRPTDSWIAGEYLSDTFVITLPEGAQPGPYSIEVGWYDASDPALPRLSLTAGGDGDRVILDSVLERR